ncbi:MAG: helix-turn-helix transcriptional regulator [Bacteroidales bacterium]|nr:helix-turn-helix transcriptional regulator [Bacteroidales bacterium]
MKLGDRLKQLRLAKQLTQRQVAAQLNVAPSIYNRFERNERKVKKEMLPKLSEILGISIEELNTIWVADQIYKLLEYEQNPNDVISIISKDFA